MSFKEIKELRQAGKLEEALQLANQALQAEPNNIWNKRAAAWVYYDYLKKYSQPEAYDSFKENLTKIKNLQLPEDEKMLFDNCAWQIGKMVIGLQNEKEVDYRKIDELFNIIRDFHFTKPSEAYSFIYKAFHRGYRNWSAYLDFADWWGFENFRSEDYLKEELNGQKVLALVEQAYIAYSKKLIDFESSNYFDKLKEVDKEKINLFLPKLETIINKHSDYQYLPYYKAKLLLALGDDENALSAFIPFARQKRNEFWVWELLADFFHNDQRIQFACYCRALSLKTPEEYLVKIRQKFTKILIERKLFVEAKTEIQKIIETRINNNWTIPNIIIQWQSQEWYNITPQNKDNQKLYSQYISKADEIIFHDIPEETVAVESVNPSKRIIYFVKNKKVSGFFKYIQNLPLPKVGDILIVRMRHQDKSGYYKLYTAKFADQSVTSEAIKHFEGEVRIVELKNIGFVQEIFIDSKLINNYKLSNGQHIKGKAILSFNRKKQELGWKAFEIEKSA